MFHVQLIVDLGYNYLIHSPTAVWLSLCIVLVQGLCIIVSSISCFRKNQTAAVFVVAGLVNELQV
jgi:hypothetical protein